MTVFPNLLQSEAVKHINLDHMVWKGLVSTQYSVTFNRGLPGQFGLTHRRTVTVEDVSLSSTGVAFSHFLFCGFCLRLLN